jgi:hypothetical protein
MNKLIKWDFLSVVFITSIIIFGSCVVFLAALDLTQRGKIVFIILTVVSFFSSLSSTLQLKEKRKGINKNGKD